MPPCQRIESFDVLMEIVEEEDNILTSQCLEGTGEIDSGLVRHDDELFTALAQEFSSQVGFSSRGCTANDNRSGSREHLSSKPIGGRRQFDFGWPDRETEVDRAIRRGDAVVETMGGGDKGFGEKLVGEVLTMQPPVDGPLQVNACYDEKGNRSESEVVFWKMEDGPTWQEGTEIENGVDEGRPDKQDNQSTNPPSEVVKEDVDGVRRGGQQFRYGHGCFPDEQRSVARWLPALSGVCSGHDKSVARTRSNEHPS